MRWKVSRSSFNQTTLFLSQHGRHHELVPHGETIGRTSTRLRSLGLNASPVYLLLETSETKFLDFRDTIRRSGV